MGGQELWDLMDGEREPLGKVWKRGDDLPEGAYHLVVSVWTFNETGELLITKRASGKEEYPGEWENTAGSAVSGETSEYAALRELFEETGIKPEGDLEFFVSIKGRAAFCDMYIARVIGRPPVRLQEGETSDFRWVTLDEFERLIDSGDICAPVARRYTAHRGLLRGFAHEH